LKKQHGKGKIVNFGSTVERFKQNKCTTETIFDVNNHLNNEKKENQSNSNENRLKLKKVKAYQFSCSDGRNNKGITDKRPLSYDNSYQTISSKFSKKEQK
jgi:hypothetical protein